MKIVLMGLMLTTAAHTMENRMPPSPPPGLIDRIRETDRKNKEKAETERRKREQNETQKKEVTQEVTQQEINEALKNNSLLQKYYITGLFEKYTSEEIRNKKEVPFEKVKDNKEAYIIFLEDLHKKLKNDNFGHFKLMFVEDWLRMDKDNNGGMSQESEMTEEKEDELTGEKGELLKIIENKARETKDKDEQGKDKYPNVKQYIKKQEDELCKAAKIITSSNDTEEEKINKFKNLINEENTTLILTIRNNIDNANRDLLQIMVQKEKLTTEELFEFLCNYKTEDLTSSQKMFLLCKRREGMEGTNDWLKLTQRIEEESNKIINRWNENTGNNRDEGDSERKSESELEWLKPYNIEMEKEIENYEINTNNETMTDIQKEMNERVGDIKADKKFRETIKKVKDDKEKENNRIKIDKSKELREVITGIKDNFNPQTNKGDCEKITKKEEEAIIKIQELEKIDCITESSLTILGIGNEEIKLVINNSIIGERNKKQEKNNKGKTQDESENSKIKQKELKEETEGDILTKAEQIEQRLKKNDQVLNSWKRINIKNETEQLLEEQILQRAQEIRQEREQVKIQENRETMNKNKEEIEESEEEETNTLGVATISWEERSKSSLLQRIKESPLTIEEFEKGLEEEALKKVNLKEDQVRENLEKKDQKKTLTEILKFNNKTLPEVKAEIEKEDPEQRKTFEEIFKEEVKTRYEQRNIALAANLLDTREQQTRKFSGDSESRSWGEENSDGYDYDE